MDNSIDQKICSKCKYCIEVCPCKIIEINPDGSLLDNAYHRYLTLFFSITFPEFTETTTIDADVDKDGKIVFGIGSPEYFGEDDNGQLKIRRYGELVFAPDGNYFTSNDIIHFDVNENTSITENMIVWYWDYTKWVETINENVTELWDGGLDFIFLDATTIGSVVEVSNENGTVDFTPNSYTDGLIILCLSYADSNMINS